MTGIACKWFSSETLFYMGDRASIIEKRGKSLGVIEKNTRCAAGVRVSLLCLDFLDRHIRRLHPISRGAA
jgi:hypothetical protein